MATWPLAELQICGQAHAQRLHRILNLGAGIHCREPISARPPCPRTCARCTVLMPLAAAQVLALHVGNGRAGLLLARLIQRPDHQPAAAAGPAPRSAGRPPLQSASTSSAFFSAAMTVGAGWM
jgi:hypothetical protein